jgi:hypothetical protein
MAIALRPFGPAIATREIEVRGSIERVVVELGAPFAVGNDYHCPIRISCGATIIHREIPGVDAFQALQLALYSIATELKHSQRLPTGAMHWLNAKNGIGFEELRSNP